MIWQWAVLTAVVLCQVNAQNSYVVTLPTVIRPGLDMKILVNILKATGDVTVTTSLWRTQGSVIFPPEPPVFAGPAVGVPLGAVGGPAQALPAPQGNPAVKTPPQPAVEEKIIERQVVVSAGNLVTVSMTLPDSLPPGNYYLLVKGTGALTFEKRGELRLQRNSLVILTQTDKGIYRPGQTVLFRTFAIKPDLKPYNGTFDINVFDANNNRIKQFVDVNGPENIWAGQFKLSDQPVMGVWRIEAKAGAFTETIYITVEQFVLPKFEVTVDVPSFGHTSDTALSGTVEAKYTFGKQVDGNVVLRVKNNNPFVFRFAPGSTPSCQEPIVEKRFALNGRTSFTIDAADLQFLNQGCNGKPKVNIPSAAPLDFLRGTLLLVEADVTESLTGNTLSGSDKIEYSEARYKLTWLKSNSPNFKPGLWYDAFLQVTTMDGSPVPITQQPQFVDLDVVADFEDGCAAFIEPNAKPKPVKTPTRLRPVRATLPKNGIIYWSDIVPEGSVSVTFTASFPGAFNASLRLEQMDSPSDNYIQVFLVTPSVTAGGMADFEILSTVPIKRLVYQIISRGNVVRSVEIDGMMRTGFFEMVSITNQMAPSSKFLVYTVLANGEVLADSVSFNVDGIYDNQVSLNFSHSRAEPGQDVSVTVTSDANSIVNVMAVDQSILLLDKGNDITRERVESKIAQFSGNSGQPLFGRLRFPVPLSGGDVTSVFRNAEVTIITDAQLHIKVDCRVRTGRQFLKVSGVPEALPQTAPLPNDGLVDPARVRTLFPDTWLWVNRTTGSDGRAVFSAKVPDTITSWVASAFAINSVSGLGIAPTNPKLEAFMPFFVTLNLPKSVIRGEEVILQAIVFNFLPVDTPVAVTLSRSTAFLNIGIDSSGQTTTSSFNKTEQIQVNAGEAKSVFFPIIPTVLGNIDLAVTARSSVAGDALIRQLRVEPEGVSQEYNQPLLIDLSTSSSFSRSLAVPLPSNIVPDSVKVKANVLGDILGPTINNLDNLLQMPSGCGEQNMIHFAPDVFILEYLTATSQLTPDIRDKAIGFLEQGYQRELSYQRNDGSFSAFGNRDPSGSMWLTAFVVDSFCKAKPFTFIDDRVVNRAIDWIVNNQAPNGAFPEVGNVIHSEMQGGAASGTALTAYVVVAIAEKENLTTDHKQMQARVSAISKARSFLESETVRIMDTYALSIVSYALKLAGSRVADRAFARMENLATGRNGEKFWSVDSNAAQPQVAPLQPGGAMGLAWTPPIVVKSLDVEATAYGLLTIAQFDNTTGGLPVIKWLAQQRSPNGGFASTQDTVVALKALSEFARLIYKPNSQVDVNVISGSFNRAFSVTRSNSLILQSENIPGPPNNVTVSASGSGTAVVDIAVSYNVFQDSQSPSFDIKVTLLNETMNGFIIETCATYLKNGKGGMVVQETGIPTGFEADLESIGEIKGLKRTDPLDRKVVFYFDQVTSIPMCVSMKVDRVGLVAKTQAVPVRIYQYYKIEEQVTVFYQPMLLKNSNFCDVCADCKECPPKPT